MVFNIYIQKHPEELFTSKSHRYFDLIYERSLKAGIRGFLYLVLTAKKYLSYAYYWEFMKPYDLQLIESIKELMPMFVVHVNRDSEHFKDYDFDRVSPYLRGRK